MRVPGRRKDIQGIGRPEMQQEEAEVWKAAATSTIYYTRYAFSNNFAKFEGKTDTIKIRCPFITQSSCMIILPIFIATNSAMYLMGKKKKLARTLNSRHSSVPAPTIKRATLKLPVHVNY